MTESAFLDDAEVRRLTERVRYAAQRKALRRQRIPFIEAPSGAPIVRRSDLQAAIAGDDARNVRPLRGPRFDRWHGKKTGGVAPR